MTRNDATPKAGDDPYAIATRDDPVRLPSWMTGAEAAMPLTRRERARLAWGRSGEARYGFVLAVVVAAFLVATAMVGYTVVDRIRTGTTPAVSPAVTPQSWGRGA